MEGEAPDRDDVPSPHGSAEELADEEEYEGGNYYDEDDPHFQMLLKLGYGKHIPENVDNDHSHENHGHPKLTDPNKEHWMMWEEWDPGVLKDHQETLMLQFEILTRPEITAFYQLDAERRGRLVDGTYDERQAWLVSCFDAMLNIALPKHLDPLPEKKPMTQTSLDKYRTIYQRVKLDDPADSIRMLEICPGETGQPLEGRLFSESLTSPKTVYEALSYAWGPVVPYKDMINIRINGLIQRVTPSLYEALISLRLTDRCRTLWVDSICINQGDLGERAEQVTLMSRIYNRAERTIVHLGASTTVSKAFFNFLRLPVCEVGPPCGNCGFSHSDNYWRQLPGDACTNAGLDEAHVLEGFIDVCSRRWWDRVWVLQEFVLSKEDPSFYCGRDVISNRLLSKNFSKVYHWVMHRKMHPNPVLHCKHFSCNGDRWRHLDKEEEGDEAKAVDGNKLAISDGDKTSRQTCAEVQVIDAETGAVRERGSMADVGEDRALGRNNEHRKTTGNIRGIGRTGQNDRDSTQVEGTEGEESKIKVEEDRDDGGDDSDDDGTASSMSFANPKRWRGIGMATQEAPSSEWSKWGSHVWKADAVMKRRSTCRSWHTPNYFFMTLQASCTDPHDIVYGVRELIEPSFRDIFVPDYTMSISKLYTRLAAYVLIIHRWTDMFWYFPHRVSITHTPGVKSVKGVPSWVPDFTRPYPARDDEQKPNKRNGERVIRLGDMPLIIDRVLFLKGWLLDEIIDVYPLPKHDGFKILQQLWYLERVYDKPPYMLIDGKQFKESVGIWAMLEEYHGFTPYPSIAWATRYSNELPHDISLVHVISALGNFEDIPGTIGASIDKVEELVRRQMEVEAEGSYEETISDEQRAEEFRGRARDIKVRLVSLCVDLISDKWLDFIGICTFDYENLRAQVRHRLIPSTPWMLPRLMKKRVRSFDEDEENLTNPPLTTAVLQRPMMYGSLLNAIANGAESEEELELRQEAVMMLADTVCKATESLVGSQGKVSYVDLGDSEGKTLEEFYPSSSRQDKEDDRKEPQGYNSDTKYAHRPSQVAVDDFLMSFLSTDEPGIYKDGPIIVWSGPIAKQGSAERREMANFASRPQNPWRSLVTDDSSQGDSLPEDSEHDSGRNVNGSVPGLQSVRRSESGSNLGSEAESDQSDESIPTSPSGLGRHWRRTQQRDPGSPHSLLTDLITFLAGREFFYTQTGLIGLTGPGTHGVRDGDDLMLFRHSSFPVIARLEPSPMLGNPKRRRREEPTKRMRREILGTAIVRDIDANGVALEDIKFPEGFEPLCGAEPGMFRFK
ncbi:hypothetical protein N3K66_008869 [Trichothecium roseum]|uniref:Uncharacterized protein n=1 Tax=Trichothecium roseum TaxID=47278 RepID=A0ACC0UT56_9HYPO|nr:hypothetical protein N3K66_008869 [Trichothecium roseum]